MGLERWLRGCCCCRGLRFSPLPTFSFRVSDGLQTARALGIHIEHIDTEGKHTQSIDKRKKNKKSPRPTESSRPSEDYIRREKRQHLRAKVVR